jgi:hypothetical protein
MDQLRLHRLRVQDRAELSTLLGATHSALNTLRRDQCGDWTISGSRGHIRACDGQVPRLCSVPFWSGVDPRQEAARQLLDGPSGR